VNDIDMARTIRDVVLRSDDIEWGSTSFRDAEHPCWHVRGADWRATVSNLWDVMNVRGAVPDEGDRFVMTQQSIIEVFDHGDDMSILGMSYGDTAEDDLLFRFDRDACARIFKVELALDQLRRGSRSGASGGGRGIARAA
jgi:hypothetical protein